MTSYATTIKTKAWMSRGEFELICRAAAENGTSCRAYIRKVLMGIYHWLDGQGVAASQRATAASSGNAQALVVSLYRLLEERCEVDFDVSVVLNACAPPYQIEEIL
jgi:hypothetical protein